MVSVTRRLAFYDLRDWWLSDPEFAVIFGYDGTNKPFYPVAEQPESGFPHVLYTVSRNVPVGQFWMHTEIVGLEMFLADIEDSTEALNIMIDMAGNGDVAARELQKWVRAEGRTNSFQFHSIYYIGGGDIGAPDEEGGAPKRIANFAIEYSPLEGSKIA